MDDRDRIATLLGQKVAVKLTNVEARDVQIIATLDEVRDDGIVLSEIGELGSGPTLFCPWDSLWRVGDRPPWLRMPHEEPGPEEEPLEQRFYGLWEATAEEIAPEPPVERRGASARNLQRVVPIAQRRTVGEITVALTSWSSSGNGSASSGTASPTWWARSKLATDSGTSPSLRSLSGMDPAASCPGHRKAGAAPRARQTATWRFASCRRPES